MLWENIEMFEEPNCTHLETTDVEKFVGDFFSPIFQKSSFRGLSVVRRLEYFCSIMKKRRKLNQTILNKNFPPIKPNTIMTIPYIQSYPSTTLLQTIALLIDQFRTPVESIYFFFHDRYSYNLIHHDTQELSYCARIIRLASMLLYVFININLKYS